MTQQNGIDALNTVIDSLSPSMKKFRLSAEVEREFEVNKWYKLIPAIKFPPEWAIQMLPMVVGSIVRFRVKCGKADVSVYLDGYELTGIAGLMHEPGEKMPFWEVYPIKGDVERFNIDDVAGLLDGIQRAIDEVNR